MLPDNVFASVKVKVSLPVPPTKLPKLLKVNVVVASFTVPLLLFVMLQVLTVFSPVNVFAAVLLPSMRVILLKPPLIAAVVPLKPLLLEPVKVTFVAVV